MQQMVYISCLYTKQKYYLEGVQGLENNTYTNINQLSFADFLIEIPK